MGDTVQTVHTGILAGDWLEVELIMAGKTACEKTQARGKPSSSKNLPEQASAGRSFIASICVSANAMSAAAFLALSFKTDNLTSLILKMGAFFNHFKATFSAEAARSCSLDLLDRLSFDGPAKELSFEVFAGGTGALICVRLE